MSDPDPINQYQPNSPNNQSIVDDLSANEEKQLHLLFQHTLQETMRNAPKIMFSLGTFLFLTFGAYVSYTEFFKPTSTTSQANYQDNLKPAFTKINLPVGITGVEYSGFIIATDPNTDDTLTLNISNLPPGLSINNCQQKPSQNSNLPQLTCMITGTPTKQGSYQTEVEVRDKQSSTAIATPIIDIR